LIFFFLQLPWTVDDGDNDISLFWQKSRQNALATTIVFDVWMSCKGVLIAMVSIDSKTGHGYLGSTVNEMRLRFKRRRPSMGVEGKKKSKKKVGGGGACSVGIKNIAPA
jgi:hypothetical protein